ncbi:RNA-directed DNA polymerase, eukaryota [Tanacetum coccineum]|uniref:RNA-directed DNA polymerase, eukaryota n=1 Tax=Tanacetum coccineum TaxID=301880 RepID=A0ABQ5HZF9_9ASTR
MEDDVARIAKSVFVTNFPDSFGPRDLWNLCQAYGKVVDVFIPYRKSKSGKRYAFVRFIRVDNIDRLIDNLCTLWVGRLHLHANAVRYERPKKSVPKSNGTPHPSQAHGDNTKPGMALHGVEGLVDESDEEAVSETLFESGSSSQNDVCVNDQNEALINDGKAQDVIQKSDDPFEIYDILNKPPVNNAVPDPSLSHPPGYTPKQLNSETPVENSCAREESPLLQEDASRADVAKDVGSNVSESVSEFSSNIPTRINSHGGSMLDMLDDIIKVGQSMGYVMEGLGHKTKKEWIKELNFKHRINFLAIQETKLECISDMDFKIEGPIVLKEVSSDYGPTPFRMYHSWFSYEGFHAMVTQAWHSFPHNDSNNLICFKKKLQDLKKIIRGWIFQQNLSKKEMKASLLKQLVDIDKQLENGVKTDEMLLNRLEVSRRLHNLNQSDLNDAAQKAKVKWAIEGDENSKFFHGVINKKREFLLGTKWGLETMHD